MGSGSERNLASEGAASHLDGFCKILEPKRLNKSQKPKQRQRMGEAIELDTGPGLLAGVGKGVRAQETLTSW